MHKLKVYIRKAHNMMLLQARPRHGRMGLGECFFVLGVALSCWWQCAHARQGSTLPDLAGRPVSAVEDRTHTAVVVDMTVVGLIWVCKCEKARVCAYVCAVLC